MQFKITVEGKNIILPISYHSILQALVYHILSDNSSYASFLHDQGYLSDSKVFKLFTFSLLYGKYEIKNKQIIFKEGCYFYVASPSDMFCNIFYDSVVCNNNIRLGNNSVIITEIESIPTIVNSNHVIIEALSPICESKVPKDNNKKTVFINPNEAEFNYLLNINFASKYKAFYKKNPESAIYLIPINFNEKDKYVTKFDNRIFITAWKGKYELIARAEYISFLLNAGLGSRNSQGFGMFKII